MERELSARMWALTGKPMVTYARSELPIKVIRRCVCEIDSTFARSGDGDRDEESPAPNDTGE